LIAFRLKKMMSPPQETLYFSRRNQLMSQLTDKRLKK
jgi:hypothetical protein